MYQQLQVVRGTHGEPIVNVPAACLWDLVEYLSFQRVSVTYHFEQTHFVVVFPKSDVSTAQRLINDWVTSSEHAMPLQDA